MPLSNPNDTLQDMEATSAVYTLGIASRLSGIPAHSIRQYIDRGLLIPFKLDSKRHLFSRIDIGRLKRVHHLIHEQGLNIAGIRALMAALPCWAIRGCSSNDRASCTAYFEVVEPCWEASGKGRECRNQNCRECKVYNAIGEGSGLKSVIRQLV
jgi:MerR family transcriptional regulator, heat shock protein HspR